MPANYTHSRNLADTLTDTVYNGDHVNHVNFFTAAGIDDYSTSVAQMQITTDPGELGTESLATSLAGELERLRFAIREVLAASGQWYTAPSQTLEKFRASCLLKKTANQSIPTGVNTVVTFASAVYDDLSLFNPSNPSRITVPAGVTKIRLTANCRLSASSTAQSSVIQFLKNGALGQIVRGFQTWDAGGATQNNLATPWFSVAGGDYFELFALQNTGANINVEPLYTWFSAEVIP